MAPHMMNPSRFTPTIFTWSNDFSSSTGFTNRGTGINVNNVVAGALASNVGGGSDIGTAINIGGTLSDTTWVCDTDFNLTSISGGDAGSAPSFFGAVKGQFDAGFEIGIFEYLGANTTLALMDMDATTHTLTNYGTALTAATRYYIRYGRNTATQSRLSVFTDSGRTTELNTAITATIDSAIIGLDEFNGCNNDAESSLKKRYWNCQDVAVYDGVTTPP